MDDAEKDAAFLTLAGKRGLLSSQQGSELAAFQREEAAAGRPRAAAQAALEKGMLTEEQVLKAEQEVWIQSVPKRLGDYELVRLVGRGGMAAVFEATSVSLGKTVAVKALMPPFCESSNYLTRFRREAALAAKPTHPNTVQVFHYGQEGDIHFLVMEFVEGQSVTSLVKARGALSEHDALEIAIRVARSLDEAREYGIVHRDVKPSNIRVSKWGTVKLMDFGVAKLTGDLGDTGLRETITIGVVGTPHYMSTEQVRGARDLDFRTDMYSLGATLFYMLTGQTPYESAKPQEVMQSIASRAPREIRRRAPHLSESAYQIVERSMARERGDRFDSFAEMIGTMEAARDKASHAATKPIVPRESAEIESLVTHADAPPSWLRTVVAAGAVVAIGTLVLLTLRAGGCLR